MGGSEPLLVLQGARAVVIVLIIAAGGLATLAVLLRLAVHWQRRDDEHFRTLAARQLEAAIRRAERDRFFAALLEEVRNPLDRLHATVGELSRRCDNAELAPAIAGAGNEVDRLRHISSRIATLVAAARAHPRVDSDVTEAARAAIEKARPSASARNVCFTLDAPDPVPCHHSVESIRDAVSELLDNAIRVSIDGSHIELRVRRVNGVARIEVQDFGPGIPAAQREAIFNPLTRRARGALGDGFGLAIAREAARAHGGNVFVASEEKEGAKVVLEIPAE